ncbi:MAG: 2Fe-2S iron-sulfur cluster-binding protein [Campylobacterota bacterium]|nr:2Fe-2S iron-sulfur cluster-binding protein [Campylobacterota bacterium]
MNDKMINFKIDGISVAAAQGESIIEVARSVGAYIPTMCYLPKTTPNASCRMCSVEVKGQNGFVLSCNTPPVEGIEVITDSEALYTERQNIMKMYNVNHPLQCGVCDKSGECDLQNKTLDFGLDEQTFAVRDQARKKKKWGVHTYDPGLCIMCEKCTAACNEIIGAEALYIKPGGYKSEIDINMKSCIECGECIAVCPVGAMASTDFKYVSNAWELNKVPSSCAHCSSACALYYESKHIGIDGLEREGKIYRVTNDADFTTLCGAGRFGFDYENIGVVKDEKAFISAIEKFKSAKNVMFNSTITNEEAYLLQKLKSRLGFNLVNDEAKKFQSFMRAFEETAGESLYNATLADVEKSDFIVSVGSSLASDNPMVLFAIAKAVNHKRAYVSYIHPVKDANISNLVTQFIKNEVGSEEAALAMIADAFVEDKSAQEEFFENLDLGYLSGESNIAIEEIELLKSFSKRKKAPMLIIGEDIINHPKAKNIAKIAGYLQKMGTFKVLIIPPVTNSLGVSLICDLDDKVEGSTIGYNSTADFTLSSKSEGDLDMPALNQQEGTFVNIDKNLVVLNPAVGYTGYELNDLANSLGLEAQNVIDYTSELGFENIKFDDLEQSIDNSGNITRGYTIMSKVNGSSSLIDDVDDLSEYNGSVVYSCNSLDQFNQNTKDCKQIEEKIHLIGSKQFATASRIKPGDTVTFNVNGQDFTRKFKVDKNLIGTIALNPNFDLDVKSPHYRYTQVKIEVVNG